MPFNQRREPQPALSGSKMGGVLRAARSMRDKQLALAMQEFSMTELMNLFVEPRHYEHLRYAYDLVEPSGLTSNLYVRADMPPHIEAHAVNSNNCYFKFTWWGKLEGGFHVPEAKGSDQHKWAERQVATCDPALMEKFREVERDMLDIQCRFALVERVVRNLNERTACKSLPQMRYVWPALPILLTKAGYSEDAKSIAEPSLRAGEKVVLENWLVALLKETSDTIVRGTMLDDVPMPADNDHLPTYVLNDSFRTG